VGAAGFAHIDQHYNYSNLDRSFGPDSSGGPYNRIGQVVHCAALLYAPEIRVGYIYCFYSYGAPYLCTGYCTDFF
jgi:hypothetical protein